MDSALVDDTLAAFILSGLSIQVAACRDDGRTTLVRGAGARLSADRRQLTVLVPASQSASLLQSLAANGRIAVLFNEPESHRSVQLKGRDAVIGTVSDADRAALPAYVATLTRRLQHYRIPEAFCRALFSVAPDDLAAVTFTPGEAYGQTPGPHAGEPLRHGEADERGDSHR
ncbi:MAG: pyridoxamine 5'-phosphate oxidase family protein [Oceanospirillaceae bacterium]|nr:pyridoxamine 5'-phosphate oxidase family protein [Oceanospirillaceae bacterium]